MARAVLRALAPSVDGTFIFVLLAFPWVAVAVSASFSTGYLLFVLALEYVLAMSVGFVVKSSRLSLAQGVAYTAATWFVVSLAMALVVSKLYWGYWVSRPPLLPLAQEIGELQTLTFVRTVNGQFEPTNPPEHLSAKQQDWVDDYMHLEERFLFMPEVYANIRRLPPTSAERLNPYRRALLESRLLAKSAKGYDSAAGIRGVVAEYRDPQGRPRVFLGLRGGQVSNDHYPFYEMVLAREGGSVKVLAKQRFFYDVAGIEGAEAPALFYVFGVLLLPAAICVVVIVAIQTVQRRGASPTGKSRE
ncbi:MAG: hypothetical protein AB1725_09005 [Armatimonadota bacterium]